MLKKLRYTLWKVKKIWINYFLSLLTLFLYFTPSISTEKYPFFGFVMLTIPLFLLLHFLIVLYWAILRSPKVWISLFTLLLGYTYIRNTVSLHWHSTHYQAQKKNDPAAFDILSYNARIFNSYPHLQKSPEQSKEMIQWVIDHKAPVKCIQEFYNLDISTQFNTFERFEKQGYHYHASYRHYVTPDKPYFGTVIFSKYPIVHSGDIRLDKYWHKRGVFIDIKINHKMVRIVNVHLHSLHIDAAQLVKQDGYQQTKQKYLRVLRKVKNGYQERARQVHYLEEHLQQKPHNYEMILCGDFNDLPYSYTYHRLKKCFYNSFETAGNGFGFSYHGKLPFLRIDNQFYTKGIRCYNFQTLRHIGYSDHHPIVGSYILRK